MNYRIGEIAKLMGVSIEAIRFFEKRGLVSPQRDEESGRRTYNAVDYNILMRARGYSRFGFTLAEAAALIENCDLSDMAERFETQCTKLKEQIRFQELLLDCLRQRQRHLDRISGMVGQCVVEKSPQMYGILFRTNLDITKDETLREQARRWGEYKPFAETLLSYPVETLCGRGRNYFHGLCMMEEFAREFGVTDDPDVICFPAQRAVFSVECIPYEATLPQTIGALAFDEALRFIKERGLTVAGESYGRTLHTSKKDGQYVHYSEQWIPVKET